MNPEDYCLKCVNCGYQSDIDPALLDPGGPMQYCPDCDEPLVPPGDIEPTSYWNGYEYIKND